MSNRVYRSTIFRSPWKRWRLAAGHFPAADWSPIGRPDAFHWQWVTDWSPVDPMYMKPGMRKVVFDPMYV